MKIQYQLISTSGNPTALVFGRFNIDTKNKITQQIFNTNKLVEQVGYLSSLKNNYYLEMMGNEFCGNACRAAGFSLLKFQDGQIKLKSSGTNKPITQTTANSITKINIPYRLDTSQLINISPFCLRMFGSLQFVVESRPSNLLISQIIDSDYPH